MLSTEAFDAMSNEGKRAYLNRIANKIRDDVSDVARTMGSIIAERDAEIARLRAELDAARAARDGAITQRDWWREQADSARAALDKEREACDAWRAASRTGGYESLKNAEEYHDARRSAEAKCDGCDLTRERCDDAKTHGRIACCPDCDHRASETKEPR